MQTFRTAKTILLATLTALLTSCATGMVSSFQNDADLIRLEHLGYWSGLIEEYYSIHNSYPLQASVVSSESPTLVKIATKQQSKQITSFMSHFNSASMSEFVQTLESGLGREIDEKYDIQKIPTQSPIGYYYFATTEGYVLWVTCITCGVTKTSTLLMDGFTPTVNIVSPSMKGKVTKALTREEMINDPLYQSWLAKPYFKEEYIRTLEKSTHKDSKG